MEGDDLGEKLRKVQRGEIDWPRGARFKRAPQALIAICRKAMALQPQDRYASALDVAREVEHWLADEPVSAYPEPWPVRAGRWLRKHRTLTTSAAAVVLVSLVATLAGLVIVTGLNRRLDAANADLGVALEKEHAARTLAEDRKKEADENFKEALDAVKAQVFDIDREPKNRSGTRDLREKLQKSATERLKKLVERASQRAAVDRTAFWAHVHLGDVYFRVDLRPSLAKEQYLRAEAIAKQLTATDPSNTEAQTDLMISHRRLWTLAIHNGQYRLALGYLRDCRAIASRLEAGGKLHGQFKGAVELVDAEIAACELLMKLSPGLIDDPAWSILWGWPRF